MTNGEPWNDLLACFRIFGDVQAIEPFLRDGLAMSITRSGDHVVSVKVYARGESTALHRHKIRAKDVTHEGELILEIGGLWHELRAKRLIGPEVLDQEEK